MRKIKIFLLLATLGAIFYTACTDDINSGRTERSNEVNLNKFNNFFKDLKTDPERTTLLVGKGIKQAMRFIIVQR